MNPEGPMLKRKHNNYFLQFVKGNPLNLLINNSTQNNWRNKSKPALEYSKSYAICQILNHPAPGFPFSFFQQQNTGILHSRHHRI